MTLERSRLDPLAARRSVDLGAVVWRGLLSPWLLLVVALPLLLQAAASSALPQLPGQLNDEPAAAARWLLATASNYGGFGSLAGAIGLFNVLHSLLFRVLLAFLSLLIALHLLDTLGRALAVRGLVAYFRRPAGAVRPMPLPAHPVLYRTRSTVDVEPPAATAQLAAALSPRFDYTDQAGNAEATDATDAAPVESYRLLGLRHRWSYMLQALPPLGLLLLLIVVWLFLLAGWDISSPILAPGESYRSPARNLLIQYKVDDNDPAEDGSEPSSPALSVTVQTDGHTIRTPATREGRAQSGGAQVRVAQEGAGLLVRSVTGSPLLALPGQAEPAASAGLILPSPGSEESLLLPDLAAGLRVVRPADGTESFIVEVYRGLELAPDQRIRVAAPLRQEIDGGDRTVLLEFIPLPGLRVNVRHMPGLWLIWPAAVLIFAGIAGYVQPPAFAVLEIAPWPRRRAVVSVQASDRRDLNRLPGLAAPAEPPSRPLAE